MYAFFKPAITVLVLWLAAFSAFSQAPDITYTTPNVYIVGAVIPALNPFNTGGAVPATIYSETKILAGSGLPGSNDGNAATATFVDPYGLTVDANGNIYLAESANYRIRKITPTGTVTTIAPDGIPGSPNIASPKFNTPHGVVRDAAGNLYVANYGNHNILKILPDGTISVFAGGFGSNGLPNDGQGTDASIINPNAIAIDAAGNLYVSDGSNLIRKISPTGYVYTFAGSGMAATVDGKYNGASFNTPAGLAVDATGNIFVAEQAGRVIRKITPNGDVTTIAGSGQYGTADGIGTAASFEFPLGIAVDPSGNLYVTDGGGTIRRISADDYSVTTIAGGGPNGTNTGVGKEVSFNVPSGIAINPDGNLYITEINGNIIKQVIATGYIIDKALPPGLVFDPKTGIISGTPTVTWPATDYKVTAFNVGGSSSFVLNIKVNAVPDPMLIVSSATGSMSSCFGSVSTNYQQFTVSGTSLTNDIIINAPAGFEVSLLPDQGYANTLTLQLATLDPDGTEIYVRLAATAPVGVLTGDVVLRSEGAADALVTVSGEVKQVVTPSVTISQQGIACPGQSVTFVATPVNGGINAIYKWFVNGVNQGGNSSPTFTITTINSTSVVACTLTNIDDCTTNADANSNQLQPQYKPLVTPEVSINQQILGCPGEQVILIAMPVHGGDNAIYEWYVNGSPQQGQSGVNFISSALSSTDIVTVKITNVSDCTNTPSVISSGVFPQYIQQVKPEITIKATTATTVCAGTTVSFEALPNHQGSNPTYLWLINGVNTGAPSIQPYTSVTTFVSGDYKVSCIITNTDVASCGINPQKISNEITITVLSSGSPLVSVAPSSAYPVCEGSQVIFAATSPDAVAGSIYQWQVNHVNAGENKNTFASSSLKKGDVLTCTVSNPSQCSSPGISDEFKIETNTVPVVSFNGDVTIKKGESVVLNPTVSPDLLTYSWSPSDGLSDAGILNPVASPAKTTSYTLKVTEVAGGCPAFADITVNVVSLMVIPNTFTPNADGVNDTWSIPALSAYPNCVVNVFNRNGSQIFRSIGYSKDWNGSFNGYVLPTGTYYYVVDLKDGNKPLSGYVVLLK
ncbi:gliding motility-associated C-terminal domain-containing protein [Mucilaginibacter angelicae]|uniref:Gliding motility-associated C-terminal domain-containing protein n=1 Tax=Mucilaginibacter angelicae TaxID=869718 RepID=A0ABV6KZ65_9SPHI